MCPPSLIKMGARKDWLVSPLAQSSGSPLLRRKVYQNTPLDK